MMNALTFEEYRYLWNLVSKKPFQTGFPLHLDIELSSYCNLKCEMCFQQYIEEKREFMKDTLFKKIVDEGANEGLCAIKLQSRGESLTHPKLIEYLAYAKENGILDINLKTNGLLLTEEKIKGLVENRLNLLILSIDEFHYKASSMKSEKEYTEFMQDVVQKVIYYRNKYNTKLSIRIQSCIKDYTSENINKTEIKNRELFSEVDFVLINPLYASHEDEPHLAELSDYDFYPCSYLWQRLTVYADGSVTTCSRDYNCKFNRIGNAMYNKISDLWMSPVMHDLRQRHLTGRRKDFHLCSLCENYLVKRDTGMPGALCTGTVYNTEHNSTK